MSKKQKVLFIGSFQSKSKTGHVGGQMFACNSDIEGVVKLTKFITRQWEF